eukprot:1554306-Rhodomonas_salina.3
MAIRVHPSAFRLLIVPSAVTSSLTTVLDSVGYRLRSDSDDALPPHTNTGVSTIDAASARGPVTADRYVPMIACLPSLFHSTACPTATDGSAC